MQYLIGQRVILNDSEIGELVVPENIQLPNTSMDMWVYSPMKGYASRYSVGNFKPLPNGQL